MCSKTARAKLEFDSYAFFLPTNALPSDAVGKTSMDAFHVKLHAFREVRKEEHNTKFVRWGVAQRRVLE
jgi:hypothetical protein